MSSVLGFLEELRRLDIRLSLQGDRLVYDAPAGAMTDALRQEVVRLKPQLTEALRSEAATAAGPRARTEAERAEPAPLSYSQQRLWFLDQLHPGSYAYNIPFHFRLHGPLDVEALRQACQRIVSRHDILRTRFVAQRGEVCQQVAASRAAVLNVEDCGALTQEAWEQRQQQEITAEARTPFSLSDAPLLRLKLLRHSVDEHLLLVTMHHIVSDGVSLTVFVRELEQGYAALAAGGALAEEPLRLQYADFAAWQRKWLTGARLTRQIEFWRRHLAGSPDLLTLPLDHPRPAVQSYKGSCVSSAVSRVLGAALRTTAERQNVTLFSLMLAAFQFLLHRYSGQERVNVGFPVAGRNRSEIEPLIGFFVNTLIVPGTLTDSITFRRFVSAVSDSVISAQDHQDVPYEKLVEELQPPRSTAFNPLFQAMFSLNPPTPVLRLARLRPASLSFEYASSKMDLSLFVEDDGESLRTVLTYSTALFDETRMRELLDNYAAVLEWGISHPDRPLREMELRIGRRTDCPAAQPSRSAAPRADSAGPRSELEETIAGIWRAALRVERVSVVDNFFDIGGHSLLLMQVQAKLNAALDRSIPVLDLFQFPTVRELARHLEGSSAKQDSVAGAYARARLRRVAMARMQRTATPDQGLMRGQ